MRFRRSEYFRFEFEQPLDALFRIIEVNGTENITHYAQAKIKNISPHGMMLLTKLNLQLDYAEKIKAEIKFTLDHNHPLVVKGFFVWQNKGLYEYSYGIQIEATEESEKKLIDELKHFSRGTVYIKENQ